MKTLKNLCLLSILFVIALSACKKDDETQVEDNNSTSGTMACTADGTAWTASLAVVATKNGTLITVTGSDSNAHQCQLILNNVSGTGTYSLNGMTNPNSGRWTAGIATNQTYTTSIGQGDGSVEITELSSTVVTGNFEFTAKNSDGQQVSITSGSFNATF